MNCGLLGGWLHRVGKMWYSGENVVLRGVFDAGCAGDVGAAGCGAV